MNNIKLKHALQGSSGIPDKRFGKNEVNEMNKAMDAFLNKKGLRSGVGWQKLSKKKIGESK